MIGQVKSLIADRRKAVIVLLSLVSLYLSAASFARIYDLRLVGLDLLEAVRLLKESYLILLLNIAVVGIVVLFLSIAVWRLSSKVKNLENNQIQS
ncbi:hypothetical protein ACFO0N_08475 [Halobium salinum]|uniref:Uncharacterized protein n=1 Tax=Halobium salinum TaxID=1364940 RepID=A0ABD5PAR7_9EURY|nr:hypothetical protein [Halobium salinum]